MLPTKKIKTRVNLRRRPFLYAFTSGLFLLITCLVIFVDCCNPNKTKIKHFNRGKILAARGRHAEAIMEYQKSLAIDPRMPGVHYQIGRSYTALQYYDEAIRAFEAAGKLEPKVSLQIISEIAHVYTLSGRPALAEEIYLEVLKTDAADIAVLYSLGELKWNAGKMAKARSYFEKVLSIQPDNVEAQIALAEMAMRRGDYDVAESHLKRIIEGSDPDHETARLALAKIYRFTNREEEAIEMLRLVLNKNPKNLKTKGALAEAYLALNRLNDAREEAEAYLEAAPQNTQAHTLLGVISLRQNDYEAAIFHLTRVANSPWATAETHYWLGLALRETGQPAQAISSFQKALNMKPESVSYRLMLVQTLISEGSLDKAQKEIMPLLVSDPENEYARQLMLQIKTTRQLFEYVDSLPVSGDVSGQMVDRFRTGLKEFRKGRLEEFQRLSEELQRNAPNSPLPLNLLGLINLRRNDLTMAMQYFQRALSVDPGYAASYVNMAGVLMAIGSYDRAAQTFKKACELAPKDGNLQLKVVEALTLVKDYDQAGALLERLIQQAPNQVAYRMAHADLLISSNRYPEARRELAKVIDIDPGNYGAAYLTADTLAKEGEIAAAADLFGKLLESHPGSEDLRARLALCNLALGKRENAQEVFADYPPPHIVSPRGAMIAALVMQEQGLIHETREILKGLKSDANDGRACELMLANINSVFTSPEVAIAELRPSHFSEAFMRSYLQFLRSESIRPAELYRVNLAIALPQFGWNREGIRKLEQILDRAGPNPALLEIIGRLWQREKRPAEATACFKTALANDESYWPVLYQLGLESLRTGQLTQAGRYFRSVLKYQPDSLDALMGLAASCEAAGNDSEAIKIYTRINELYPNVEQALNNLAWLMAEKSDNLDTALEYAKKAAAVQPLNAEILDTLGWILYKKGDYERAKEELDKAASFDSSNPSIRYHRGMVFLMLEDRKQALENFLEADSAAVPFPERQLNEKMIRDLG